MGSNQSDTNQKLNPYFGRMGIWAFSIGTSIGWGSFVVTCNTYLSQAGVLGTILGILLGMAIILVINHNLCYMIERKPDAGGIYAYAGSVRGHDIAFLIAWFLLLTYLAVFWANLTSLPLFAGRFLGPFFQVGPSYVVFGYKVYFGEVLLSASAAIIGGLFCAKFKKLPQYLMIIMALTFVVCLTVVTVLAITKHGNTDFSYNPLYIPEKTNWGQIVRIAVVSPWAFIGFENVAHFSEEYSFPVKKIRGVMIISVVLTTVVYILMTLLSVSAFPPQYSNWLEYIADMDNLKGMSAVPAFYAAKYYFGNAGVTILLVALFSVIITSVIGNLTAISRLLYAYGRDHHWLGGLSKLNKQNIPSRAIFVTVLISCFVPLLGRTAIGWIVDVTTLGATIIYGFLSYSVYRDAKSCGDTIEENTGLFGTVVMIGIAILSLAPKIIAFEAMQAESYLLFATWSLLGFGVFRIALGRDKDNRYGKSIIVWVMFLLLMLLTTMMWMNAKTQRVTNSSIETIRQHYANSIDDEKYESELEDVFIEGQIDRIEKAQLRNTLSVFVLFIIAVSIIANNYALAKKREKEWMEKLGIATEIGMTDSLTGVKNKHAYTRWEEKVNKEIDNGTCAPFSIAVCDINDLKIVNDVQGHAAGDAMIKCACRVICSVFSHSPVFRYGGDEFVVIVQGEDYNNRSKLLEDFEKSTKENNITIAIGVVDFNKEEHRTMIRVFEEADQLMYIRKKELKKGKSKDATQRQ